MAKHFMRSFRLRRKVLPFSDYMYFDLPPKYKKEQELEILRRESLRPITEVNLSREGSLDATKEINEKLSAIGEESSQEVAHGYLDMVTRALVRTISAECRDDLDKMEFE